MSKFLTQKSNQALALILFCFSHRMAEDKTEEEKNKTLKEEYLPNTLLPLLERLDKRFAEKEWFVGDKVRSGTEMKRIRH